jgi:4-hydroxy-3-methylbut-2-enyl diphosphate reductase
MRIIRARHLGFCFGVRDAIALATGETARHPLTVLGELVHNEVVLRDLRAAGVEIVETPAQIRTARVMITAHGVSNRKRLELGERGLEVADATCPLVAHAHEALRRLVLAGYHPVVVGRRDHAEVLGLTGDVEEFDVVLEPEDVVQMRERARFGVVAQTTQPVSRARSLVELLRSRFPCSEVRWVDTVCQPTKQRQTAAEELARQADVVVVIGGAGSNNTCELAATCRSHCPRVHHVQTAADLNAAWFDVSDVVGVTAGTSTPDATVNEVERQLEGLFEKAGRL